MAADRMAADEKGAGAGGLESLLGDMGDLGDMDLGALMKDLDPNTLQELVMEGLKDPQIQEMVSYKCRSSQCGWSARYSYFNL